MDSPLPILSLAGAAVVGTAAIFPKLRARLALSRAKHRSLTGHAKMSRLVARLIPFYEFDIGDFFRSDGAPPAVATRRQDGFFQLALPAALRQGQADDAAGGDANLRPAIHRGLPGAVSV
jgi:glutamate-1-semialdehyde 2,1-aminomutase